MEKGAKTIIFVVYLVFGLYFINLFGNFVGLGDFFTDIEKWINLFGGILLILGGLFFLKANKRFI